MLYVVGYVALMLMAQSAQAMAICLVLLSIDDMMGQNNNTQCNRQTATHYVIALFSNLVISLSCGPSIFKDKSWDLTIKTDCYSIFFGIFLPCIVPFFTLTLKKYEMYFKRIPYRLCEQGFPFMFILGLLKIIISSGEMTEINSYQQLYNISLKIYSNNALNTITPGQVVFYIVMPVNIACFILLFIKSTAVGNTIDVLLSINLSMSCRSFLKSSITSGYAIPINCLLASIIFVCVRILNEPSDDLNKPPDQCDETMYEENIRDFSDAVNNDHNTIET